MPHTHVKPSSSPGARRSDPGSLSEAALLALGLERLWSRTPPAETTSETPESDGESSALLVDSPGCSPLDGRAPSEGDEEGDER